MENKNDYLENLAKIWRASIEETDTDIVINGYPFNRVFFWYIMEVHGPSQVRQILPKEVWNDKI